MTDPTNGSKLVTVQTPAGERHFPRLSPSDWLRLGNALAAARKQQRRAELQAEGAAPDAVKKELAEIDRRPVRYWDAERYVNDLAGSYEVIRLSLSREKGSPATEADVDALGLHPVEWLDVAAELAGLNVGTPAEGGAGGASPLPPAGEGSPPQTSTGGSSATESATTST